MPAYDLRVPATLEEALALIAESGGSWRPFAGGTDLMVLLEAGKLPQTRYVSLRGLDALTGVIVSKDEIVVRALTTYAEIRGHEELAREFPLLGAAARETGGIATQNRGTIGGNIANASPAADTPPALLATTRPSTSCPSAASAACPTPPSTPVTRPWTWPRAS